MSKRLDCNELAPAGIKALGAVYGYVAQSTLSRVLVDLVYLRVSQIIHCAYCLDMHTRDLLKKGQPVEKLALLQAWREAGDVFDPREQAALAWAESVTRVADTGVPDADYEAALDVFNKSQERRGRTPNRTGGPHCVRPALHRQPRPGGAAQARLASDRSGPINLLHRLYRLLLPLYAEMHPRLAEAGRLHH